MNLNFKKNNLLIIMLLIFVILSCIVFINMSNIKESFTNYNSINRRYFVDTASDLSYNYYILNTNIYKYKLSTLPSELILESSNNVTSENRSLTMANFRQRNLLLTYYNTDSLTTDISLLNVKHTNLPIVLDISTLPITDPSNIKTMNMIFIENSGNFYDLSNVKLSKLNMKINGELIIQNGAVVQPPNPNSNPTPDPVSNPNNFYNDFNLYLLRQGAFGSNYIPPIYNNFETAMNLPSNPIVNPINTMNPLDYANSIFGPTITPTMISSMCLNQNVAKVTDSTTILRESSNNLVSNLGNNRSNTNTNNTNTNTNTNNTNTNTNTNTNSNNTNNTNTNTNTNTNNTNLNRNQDFMRESYPPYQPSQIITNSASESEFIPRPVLTDFSSFGM